MARADTEGASLLDRLVAAETGCETLCQPADAAAGLRMRIGSLGDRLRESLGDVAGPSGRVTALNRFIFDSLGLKPSQDLKDPDNLLLGRVLDRKRGYCVGIASLYLALSERLGLSIHAVATPSHVFLRYDDGTTRINIETLQNGASIPDEEYIRDERIPEVSIRHGVFMRNLTADEFLAQVHNNLGVIYSERKEYAEAAKQYGQALDRNPGLPVVYYNYGNDLLARSDYRRAARLFSKSLRLFPTDVWALNNRGLARMKLGKPGKAKRDFEEALRIDPTFGAARKNLEALE